MSPQVADWRRNAAMALAASSLDVVPSLEADVLLAHVLGVDRSWLFAHAEESLSAAARARADVLLSRRLSGEPVAYLFGWTEFRSRRFAVGPDVLVPRDDTEVLVDAGLQSCRRAYAALQRPLVVVDAGTGSGIVAISLALELDVPALVIGLDRSEAALQVAASNAQALSADVTFLAGDWLQPLAPGSVDVVLSNPPYVAADDEHLPALAHEPLDALVAGDDGLDDLRLLAAAAVSTLAPTGALALEHGYDQGDAVRAMLGAAGWGKVTTEQDLAGRDRVTVAAA